MDKSHKSKYLDLIIYQDLLDRETPGQMNFCSQKWRTGQVSKTFCWINRLLPASKLSSHSIGIILNYGKTAQPWPVWAMNALFDKSVITSLPGFCLLVWTVFLKFRGLTEYYCPRNWSLLFFISLIFFFISALCFLRDLNFWSLCALAASQSRIYVKLFLSFWHMSCVHPED